MQIIKAPSTMYKFEVGKPLLNKKISYILKVSEDDYRPVVVTSHHRPEFDSHGFLVLSEDEKEVQNFVFNNDISVGYSGDALDTVKDSFWSGYLTHVSHSDGHSVDRYLNYLVFPVKVIDEYVIYPKSSYIGSSKVSDIHTDNRIIFDPREIYFFDAEEEDFVLKMLTSLETKDFLPFDICRMINAYRRARFSSIRDEDMGAIEAGWL